jgi:hypothetical protein
MVHTAAGAVVFIARREPSTGPGPAATDNDGPEREISPAPPGPEIFPVHSRKNDVSLRAIQGGAAAREVVMTRRFLGCLGLVGVLVACEANPVENNNQNNQNNINNVNNANNINNINNLNNINNINNINNTNNVTRIPPNQNKTEAQALVQLFPDATPERVTSARGEYYVVRDAAQVVVGYGLTATHYGFNAQITTLLGVSADGVTVGLETIDQRESWWSFVPEAWFTQFTGLDTGGITLLPDYNENCYSCSELYTALGVDAVSGATYTSDALIKDAMDGYLHWDEVVSGQ